jgi:hypothetical protein
MADLNHLSSTQPLCMSYTVGGASHLDMHLAGTRSVYTTLGSCQGDFATLSCRICYNTREPSGGVTPLDPLTTRSRREAQPMTNDSIHKDCSKCGRNLPTSGFSKDLREPSGISPICKRCRKSENLLGTGVKVCASCQSTVATEGFRENHTTWDGLASSCTGCERRLTDEYPDTKTCTKCKRRFPISEFSRDRARRDGLASSCKSCHRSRYAANRG